MASVRRLYGLMGQISCRSHLTAAANALRSRLNLMSSNKHGLFVRFRDGAADGGHWFTETEANPPHGRGACI